MADLNEAVGASRTTVLRIVASLDRHGFLARNENGGIVAGNTMQMLGVRLQKDSSLRQRAVTVLHELAHNVGETTHFALPFDTHCFLQEVVDGPHLVRVASRPGSLIEYHCSAAGKAIVAHRDDLLALLRQSPRLTRRTENTITEWDAFEVELENVRRRGYAVDEREYHEDVRCVGVPIYGAAGRVIAALGATGTANRLTKRRIPSVARMMIEAATVLGRPHG